MKENSLGFKTILFMLIIMISTCGIVYAQPPPIPSDYSGYVTVNGEPAPEGATVYAKIGDYTSDSVAVADLGHYRYLIVKPTDGTYVGETVEFYVDPDGGAPIPAIMAFETDEFEPGTSHDPFNLTVVDVTPPVIVNVSPSEVTTSGARITWITDEPSTSQVDYGKTAAYGSQTTSPNLITSHSVGLAGLEEGTTYHFRVVCADEAGNTARSGDRTFTTAATSPPPSPPPSGGGIIIIPGNEPPVAEAGPDREVYVGVAIHLSGAGSQDPDGTIEEYHWFPGDGSYKPGVKVIHVYGEAGIYTASLAVMDNNGATGTDNCTVTVLSLSAPLEALIFVAIPANSTGYVVDASSWADTTVKVNTTDDVTVSVLRYEENPHPEDPIPAMALPTYVDVAVSDPDAVVWPIYVEMFYTDEEVMGLDESTFGIYYWMDGVWQRCSDTGVDTVLNVVWAYMTAEEASGSPILIAGMPAIIVPPLPPILSNLTITPAELEPGDNVTMSLDIRNIDSQSFTYIVTMQIGELTLLVDVELGSYDSTKVSRTLTMDMVGVFNVTVDGMSGSFTVKAPPLPAKFGVSDLVIVPGDWLTIDKTRHGFTISVDVTNVGEMEGSYTVELGLDGMVVGSEEITSLGGGMTVTVVFELTRGVGSYIVEVDGLTGSFTVKAPPKPAEFVLSNFNYTSELQEGEPLRIYVDIANVGEVAGETTIIIKVGGVILQDLQSLFQLGPEEVFSQVWTSYQSYEVGTHTIHLDGFEGTFNVIAEPVPFWTTPEFIMAVIVIIAGIIATYVWRRRGARAEI